MAPETKPQDRNTDGILRYLKDYLSIREQQAIRINPQIANVIDDVGWLQVENLRQVLQESKGFGPERIRVADILVGDDELKRKGLFSHSDQNSIIHEIINRPDEQRGRVAELAIHDMRTLFRAVDPSLENIVQLIQHWLLWDLPDAADLFHFDLQQHRCEFLRSTPISDDLRERYKPIFHKRHEEPLPDRDIIAFELKRLEHTLNHVLTRRAEEKAFMMIIRRDEQAYSASSQEIIKLAKHLKTIETIEKTAGELDHAVVEAYAQALHCTPAEVTKDRVLDIEKKVVADGKRNLQHFLTDDRYLGEAYDYKKTQTLHLRERYEAEAARCEPILKAEPAEEPAEESKT